MADNEVKMMMSVYPGAMTGFAALNSGLVSINNVFGNMTRAFDHQFDLLDTAIMTTGVVVTQLGMDAMNAFGEFEQGMKIVQMVSGQTAQDIGYLSQKANEFSIQYRTDIDQITEGLQTLGRAGLNSATEQTEVLQNGLNTAKLEGRDLNSVLEELIQNTALLGGNLKESNFGEDSEYVNDLLVATSMSAPITTHDVSETLKYSGGIAAAAGAKIRTDEGEVNEQGKEILEDYMGAIAAFAQKGVTGSIAGTALRAFFNKPATQDSSVTEALGMIKLKPEYLWEDDEETMKPVSEQIGLIQKQMDKLNISTMDRLQIWSKIVGGKMGQQMMKLDSSDIKELTKDIRSADDASNLAAGSMKTYQANVKALGESGAALQRDVGEKLVFFVNPILEFINKFNGFLDNNIGASVLAGSIIAFVGMVGRRVYNVIKIIKGELATLFTGAKYHLGRRPGFAIGPNGELIADDGSKNSGKTAPKNIGEFARQYYGFGGGASIESMKKAGMSDVDIARVGIFSSLKKDSTGLGMSDADFVKKIYPSLSAAQKAQMDSLIKAAGGSSRKPFDQMFLDENKKLKTEYIDLIFKMESFERALNAATISLDVLPGSLSGFSKFLNANKSAFGDLKVKAPDNWQSAMANAVKQQQAAEAARAAQAQAHASSLGNEYKMRGDTTPIGHLLYPNTPAGGYNVPYNLLSDYSHGDPSLGQRSAHIVREYVRSGLQKVYGLQDDEGMLRTIAQSRFKNWSSFSDKVKEMHLKNLSIYPDIGRDNQIGATLYGAPVPKGVVYGPQDPRTPPVLGGLGAGAIPGAVDDLERQRLNKKKELVEQARSAYQKEEEERDRRFNEHQKRKKLVEQARNDYQKEEQERDRRFNQHKENIERQRKLDQAIRNSETEVKNRQWEMRRAEEAAAAENRKYRYQRVSESSLARAARMQRRADLGLNSRYITPGMEKYFVADQKAIQQAIKESGVYGVQKGPATGGPGGNYYALSPTQIRDINQQAGINPYPNAKERFKSLERKISEQTKKLPSIRDTGVYQNFVGRLTADRQGRFINFGTSSLGKLGNAALNLTDMFGGPLMIAIMAVTTVIQKLKEQYQEYHQDLKRLSDQLKDAYSDLQSAENGLEQTYREMNPDATDEDIETMVLDNYATMAEDMKKAFSAQDDKWFKQVGGMTKALQEYTYNEEKDDGSTKKAEEAELTAEEEQTKSIEENTGALYTATAEIQNAMSQFTSKMMDPVYGSDGLSTQISDAFGSLFSHSSFSREGGFLKTASQKDENYQGYTEMAGLMLEDFKDAQGNWIKGMRTMMGDDVETLSNAFREGSNTFKFLKNLANFSYMIGPANNARLQASMKNDTKTWQKIGKEIAKYEKKTGKVAYKTQDTRNKKLEGLVNKIQQTVGTGFTREQILQAASLQQMQDMYAVAQQAIVPILTQNMQTAANHLMLGGQTDTKVAYAGNGATSTQQTAAVIASLVAQIAKSKAAEIGQATAMQGGDLNNNGEANDEEDRKIQQWALDAKTPQEFASKVYSAEKGYGDVFVDLIDGFSTFTSIPNDWRKSIEDFTSKYGAYSDPSGANYLSAIYGASTMMTGYGYDPKSALDRAWKTIESGRAKGLLSKDIDATFTKNLTENPKFLNNIIDAYLASDIGEDDGSGGGSGGGGGGSGSGDKNNNGTRRERVDLVLCNKKEIPKLNVNLFKKPPSFTILNKNFKLRDVKINSEDKPKAIMAAIKNSFIDIQKRTDPKIIQDEDAVYDPAAATDGTNLPSGTSKTKTDSNSNS